MSDAATQARELIRIVSSDAGLPQPVRRKARLLAAVAESNPDLALERLGALRFEALPLLPLDPPEADYTRCVSLEVFWRHNLDRARKRFFATPEDYRRALEGEAAPEARLAADLGPGPLVPAGNSWLVPTAQLVGLIGAQIKTRLNSGQEPPYVGFVFSVKRMIDAGVAVRAPRGIDAIPSRLLQWYPENVPGERIDRELPRGAMERIEWRP